MRRRLIQPIKIIIQQHKPNANSKPSNNNNDTKYKFITITVSSLLAISESLPFISNIKSNGLIDILRDINKTVKEHSE